MAPNDDPRDESHANRFFTLLRGTPGADADRGRGPSARGPRLGQVSGVRPARAGGSRCPRSRPAPGSSSPRGPRRRRRRGSSRPTRSRWCRPSVWSLARDVMTRRHRADGILHVATNPGAITCSRSAHERPRTRQAHRRSHPHRGRVARRGERRRAGGPEPLDGRADRLRPALWSQRRRPGHRRGGCGAARMEVEACARARRRPPQALRPDDAGAGSARPADDPRAGEAARRGARRDRLCGGVRRVERGGGQAGLRGDHPRQLHREADPRPAPGGGGDGGHHAVELPFGDDHPQAGSGARGGLHHDREARIGNAAERARDR